MANTKLSSLGAVSSLGDTDEMLLNVGGVSKKITGANAKSSVLATGAVPTAALADGAVTLVKLVNATGQYKILARSSASAGVWEELTGSADMFALIGCADYAAARTALGVGAADNGGTGLTSYAVGDLLYASGAATLSKLADVATGNALISGGVTTAPSWGKIGLTTHVSGTLPAANGGTGLASYTIGDLLVATAGTTLAALPSGTAGLPLIAGGAGVAPAYGAVNLGTSGPTTGVLTAARGGTNTGTWTIGDTLYSSATNTLSKLAGNTTTTLKVLTQTGTGSASAAPVWAQLAHTDISGTLAIASGGTAATTASDARTALGLAIGTNVFTQRTITAGAGIAVTNGDGVSANPTIASVVPLSVAKLTADFGTVLTTNSLVSITGLSASLLGTHYYRWECHILYQSDTGTSGLSLSYSDGSTVNTVVMTDIPVAGDGTACMYSGISNADNDQVVGGATPVINVTYLARMSGTSWGGSDGTLQIKAANEAGAGNVTIKQGSNLMLWDLGT